MTQLPLPFVPNDTGNYRGKRTPPPRYNNGVPSTPAQLRQALAEPVPENTPLRRSLREIFAGAFKPKWNPRDPKAVKAR